MSEMMTKTVTGKPASQSDAFGGSSSVKTTDIRKITGIGMLSAIAFALMFLDFPFPLCPALSKWTYPSSPL